MPEEELEKLKIIFEKFSVKRVSISGTAINQVNKLLPIISADKIVIYDANMYYSERKEYFSTGAAINETDSKVKEQLRRDAGYRQTIKNIEKSYAAIIGEYDNVEFCFNDYGDLVSSNSIRTKNRIYDTIIAEAKKFNLTPLEAYLYFYNIVKLFKKYKEEPVSERPEASRKSEFVLFNEYIVCAGYATILTELVDRYNNPNLMASEYICYVETEWHSRIIVEIKDKEYNVIGMYISDITGDSKRRKMDLFLDRLDYFLMTKKELDILDGRLKDSMPDCTDVLFYNENGPDVSAKYFPSYAWDDAHYICWKFYDMSQGRTINSFYLSDPLEIRQTAISEEVISRVAHQLRVKMFTSKTGFSPINRLLWMKHVVTFNMHLQGKLSPDIHELKDEEKHI